MSTVRFGSVKELLSYIPSSYSSYYIQTVVVGPIADCSLLSSEDSAVDVIVPFW